MNYLDNNQHEDALDFLIALNTSLKMEMGIYRGPPHGLKRDAESLAKVVHFLSAGQGISFCDEKSVLENAC